MQVIQINSSHLNIGDIIKKFKKTFFSYKSLIYITIYFKLIAVFNDTNLESKKSLTIK